MEEDRDLRLVVTNDGTRLPEGFDVRKNHNLGLQIVDSLVHDDLHGNFTLESGEQITATVVFPK
jgi:two-component sensor histidine kinase